MPDDLEAAKLELLITEYKEASTAFFKGIDVGISYTRSYLYLNGILLAATGVNDKVIEYLRLDPTLMSIVFPGAAMLGICLALMFAGLIPYYDRQLDNCAGICIEIEDRLRLEGRDKSFYRSLHGINKQRWRIMTPIRGAMLLALFFSILWGVVFFSLLRQIKFASLT